MLYEFTAEEIKRAAFSVKGSSASGENGLTGVFCQQYWQFGTLLVITLLRKSRVSSVTLLFLMGGTILNSVYYLKYPSQTL